MKVIARGGMKTYDQGLSDCAGPSADAYGFKPKDRSDLESLGCFHAFSDDWTSCIAW